MKTVFSGHYREINKPANGPIPDGRTSYKTKPKKDEWDIGITCRHRSCVISTGRHVKTYLFTYAGKDRRIEFSVNRPSVSNWNDLRTNHIHPGRTGGIDFIGSRRKGAWGRVGGNLEKVRK